MKKLLSLIIVSVSVMYSTAQTLPKNSPNSEIEQIVGATKIDIKYSRPGVKERVIFGELVPYDKLWRFGANDATTIKTKHSLFFDGKELKAGTYSVFAIPGKEFWEIIFNSDNKATTDSFDEAKTVLSVKGKVYSNSYTESLFIGFDNIKDQSASIVVLWEKTKVEIPFTVKTKENSIANIKKAIKKGKDLNKVYYNAANYYYSSLKDNKQALEYVNKSIKLESNYRNLFLKARIFHELGKKDEAKELAEKALKTAKDKNASQGYQNFITRTIDKWKKQTHINAKFKSRLENFLIDFFYVQ